MPTWENCLVFVHLARPFLLNGLIHSFIATLITYTIDKSVLINCRSSLGHSTISSRQLWNFINTRCWHVDQIKGAWLDWVNVLILPLEMLFEQYCILLPYLSNIWTVPSITLFISTTWCFPMVIVLYHYLKQFMITNLIFQNCTFLALMGGFALLANILWSSTIMWLRDFGDVWVTWSRSITMNVSLIKWRLCHTLNLIRAKWHTSWSITTKCCVFA